MKRRPRVIADDELSQSIVLIDQDTVYAPRHSNDRLLLGLKGSLNEYELDLLRQRSVDARRAKARRGELIVASPAGYLKTEAGQLEKDPDRRVQEAVRLVFHKFVELGTVRQTLLWFLEHGLQLPVRTTPGEIRWKRPPYDTLYRMLTKSGVRRRVCVRQDGTGVALRAR